MNASATGSHFAVKDRAAFYVFTRSGELVQELSTDDYETWQSHALDLDFENPYIPVLGHSYQRVVSNTQDIELRPTDFHPKIRAASIMPAAFPPIRPIPMRRW